MIKLPNNMKSLIAVLRSEELAGEINQYCNTATDIVANVKIDAASIAAAPAIINGGADIVVIETGVVNSEDITALENLCAYVSRGGSFIAIVENPSPDAMRRLFRAGVTDVIPSPANNAELIHALDAARGRVASKFEHDATSPGKIITVLKTAGGVGATTVALNTAASFSSMQNGRVCVVDLDVQFGQVATTLDVSPRMNILDAIRAGARLDPMLLDSIMHRYDSGISILSAPNTTTPLEAVDEDFLDRLFKILRSSYAVSIIELPAAWTQWIGVALDKSDLIVTVAETEVRSAAGAARIMQSLIDFGLTNAAPALIINKFEKTIENVERSKRIGDILRTKTIIAVRREDKSAQEAADRGMLLADAAPKSTLLKDYESIVRKLAASIDIELDETTRSPLPVEKLISGRFGLRSRPQ